jgi:hypothetical protein
MITLIKINKYTVVWSDSEGEYTYPKMMFPDDLTMDSSITYSAGEFHELY